MSTRQSIYYRDVEGEVPKLHIYRELLNEPPDDICMEIDFGYVLINIPLPKDLQERMGIS